LSGIATSSFAAPIQRKVRLTENDIILFQGDSITDAGRDRKQGSGLPDYSDFKSMGSGYAFMAASNLLFEHPGKKFSIYNKGISGNKVYQLAERWEQDCLALKPTVLSILIGVNDFWHSLNGEYKGTVDTYHKDFEALLTRTKKELPDVKLIIGEPFAVTGLTAVNDKWYPLFNDYRKVAKEMADQFNATFIPYQSVFDKAITKMPPSYWTPDGVHPSIPGAQLMAHAWLKVVKG
jgi:lysophospholipase L1-like esterase